VGQHTFTGFDSVSDNLIVARSTFAPPSNLPDAYAVQHNGSSLESYPLYFPDIPWEYFAQEIRLSAWVNGTSGSVFYNSINYDDGSNETTTPDYEVLEEIDGWQHQMVRIPLSGLVSDFTWWVAQWVPGQFYFTELGMEVYYR
jgi:hypothetical protein